MVILLNKLGYIENYGTGIQRILEAYQGAKHQLEFYVSKSYFTVSLYSLNPIDAFDAQNEDQFDAQKPSIYEGIIREYPKCCVFDLIRLRSVYPGGMDP